jgi:hypothetical protein
MNNSIDQYLNEIEKVEAPPFLFTRIKQKMETVRTSHVSLKLAWGAGSALLLVLVLNIAVINFTSQREEQNMVVEMHLNTDNSLYK